MHKKTAERHLQFSSKKRFNNRETSIYACNEFELIFETRLGRKFWTLVRVFLFPGICQRRSFGRARLLFKRFPSRTPHSFLEKCQTGPELRYAIFALPINKNHRPASMTVLLIRFRRLIMSERFDGDFSMSIEADRWKFRLTVPSIRPEDGTCNCTACQTSLPAYIYT